MKIPARPDPEPLHAETFALRAWVLAAAALLARLVWKHLPRSWRIEARSFVRIAEDQLKFLIVQIAVAHWRLRGFHRRKTRPPSTPPGFRRGRNTISVMRKFKRVVCLSSPAIARYRRLSRGMARYRALSRVDACFRSVARRIAFMRDALRNLRFWIARLHKRFGWLKSGPRFVAVRPAAVTFSPCAVPSAISADTS